MHNFRKNISKAMVAIMLATAVLGTGVACAAPVAPSAADTATIKVKGIEADSTVTGYQVAEAVYNQYGLIEYQTVAGVSIVDIENPTEAEVTSLAKQIYTDKLTTLDFVELVYDSVTQTYSSSDAEAGSYIVLVENTTGEYVYNPVYVSNAYTDANDASTLGKQESNGEVDVDGENTLTSTGTVYAKKSYTSIDKDIVNASTGNTETDDLLYSSLGGPENATFRITTTVPDYSEGFDEVVFKITDTMDDSFSNQGSIVPGNTLKVYAGVDADTELPYTGPTGAWDFSTSGNDWTITFNSDWIKEHPLETITIIQNTGTYLGNNAVMAPEGNFNKASLEFTTTPNSTYTYDDTVALYTFQIEAEKVDADDNTVKLAGAQFMLTGNSKTWTATSDENGIVTFKNLSEGIYTLTETNAPDGYFLSDKEYTIEITAEYDPDTEGVKPNGTVEEIVSYTVTTTDNDTGEVVATAVFDSESTTKDIDLDVLNTTLSKLPSTGGAGAVVFSIIGVAGLIIGCAIVFKKDKKEA